MKITRILNNNVVQTVHEGREVVAMGRGLAFGRKVGDELPAELADKVFELTTPYNSHLAALVDEIPQEYWALTLELLHLGEKRLGRRLESRFYIALVDHIFVSVQRAREGVVIPGLFALEARRYYREEYEVACEMARMVEQRFNVSFDESEAAFITFHLIDAQLGDSSSAADVIRLMSDVTAIVKRRFGDRLDDSSLHYERFAVHLRFFSERLFKGADGMSDQRHADIYKPFIKEYPEQFACMREICDMIRADYAHDVGGDEQCYLLLHIIKVTTH